MTDEEVRQQAERLASRPYRRVISGNDVEGFLAEAPELAGCLTAGATVEEAQAMLSDAITGWIECALLAGEPVPDPEARLQRSA